MTRLLEVVDRGVIEVRYEVRKYTWTDGEGTVFHYDWTTDSGEDSDQWFASVEEATADVEAHFG